MIQLEPIQQEDFEWFLEREIRGYAEDHVRNENWPSKGALERSRQELYKKAGFQITGIHMNKTLK
ncbi:MAG TPA: hypothetical protein VGK56_10210 [Anaerolineales bacterium]